MWNTDSLFHSVLERDINPYDMSFRYWKCPVKLELLAQLGIKTLNKEEASLVTWPLIVVK